MKILKAHIIELLFTAVVGMLGIGGLLFLVGESWGWLPELKPMLSGGVDKNFFRCVSILFSFIGPLLFLLHITDGEKYYEKYSVAAKNFTIIEYQNAYVIKLGESIWVLNGFSKKAFIKRLEADGEVNFTQYYDVKKVPRKLIIHI